MPSTWELTSPKSGQSYKLEFSEDDPSMEQMQSALDQFDDEWFREQGADPSIAEQGPVATAATSAWRALGAWGTSIVGGIAKVAAEKERLVNQITGGVVPTSGVWDKVAGFSDAVTEEARSVYATNPANPTAEIVGSGVGQAAAILGTAGLGAATLGTKTALTVVPTVAGAVMGAGQGIDTAADLGIDNPAARLGVGAAFAGVEAATERFGGIGGKAGAEMLEQGVRAGLKQAGKSILSESIEEPVAGAGQEAVTRLAGSFVEDPNRPGFTVTGAALPTMEGFAGRRVQEAIGGAAGGTVFGGLQLVAGRRGAAPAPEAARPGQPPPLPQDQEDLGDLTAEEVADLEGPATPAPVAPPPAPPRAQVPAFQDDPLTAPPTPAGGNLLADYGVARTPQAEAIAQAAELERQRQENRLRRGNDQRTRPVIPDSPLGGRDILDYLNDHPLRVARKGSEEAQQAGNDWSERFEVPMYYRKFIASTERGYAPDVLAQAAYEEGLINDPSVDALMAEVQGTIQARTQYRVQFRQRDKALRQEAQQVSNFEKDQAKAAERDKTLVALDDVAPGDEMTINGERAVVRKIDYDEDGYLTNVVIEDGKRFGVLSLDPQSRSGVFVDEFVHRARPRAAADDFAPQDEEPFQLSQVSAQELNQEKARAQTRAQLAERQNRTLKGDAGEFGTPDMLDSTAGDMALFNQPAGATLANGTPGPDSVGAAVSPAGGPGGVAAGPVAQAPTQGLTGFRNLTPQGQRGAGGFVNAEVLAEARDLVLGGLRDFATWSRAMIQRFGEAIRSSLAEIWQRVLESLPSTAAQNVRLGRPQGSAQVTVNAGGFVNVPGAPAAAAPAAAAPAAEDGTRETRSRFASPEEQARQYQVRTDEEVRQQADAWLSSMTGEEAISALERGSLPANMTMDVAQQAVGLLLQRTSDAMRSGNELLAMEARAIGHRAARVWQGWLSQEAGRSLRQRVVVNAELSPFAPILAAEGMLIDRADAVMNTRFEGGAAGATQRTQALADQAAAEGSADLAEDLNAETAPPSAPGAPINNAQAQRRAAVKQKHPSLKRMLDALRKKLAPGMTWEDIFTELPSAQKARQREIYRRLKLDERLKGLTAEERLNLTNELEKAWQQKRREVFRRELKRAGVLGEKDAVDRARVEKALPKLIRMINLGMMNSEMWREAVAPQYGLRTLTNAEALSLRTLAEEAYKEPPGLLQNRKLAELLTRIQKTTGVSRAELLNNYWVASVLSGLRTMFDTFGSVINGLGTTAIQASSLALRRGNRRAALESLGQWWEGLRQGFRESGQILTKGNYSYLKRFNEDLRKALQGESSYRPLPLGEALWKDGNLFEKYGLAPLMIWTGRLMAAADHINNTATTQGAMAVARALHPELYQGKAGFTAEERAAAMDQAKREVLGGTDRIPRDRQETADLHARHREILNGLLRAEDRQEASTIGDMAAYQNDPTGAFGVIYSAVSQGLGYLERSTADYAATLSNQYAQSIMLFLSGALRSATGSKFIRFGANFGNDMVSYIPGTMLLSPAIVGREATQSQRDLLVGKNVFGLVLSLSVAALFLGKDDEEEGWHLEGGWLDLNPDEAKARRAAGYEPFTLWKREGDQVRRISYKQWPTAGIMAAVAHMQDRQRFAPDKWQSEGMAGHLLAAATVGLFQVKEAAAMRGLAELFGASRYGANPEEDFIEKMVKLPVSFAGGFIPTPLKDFDLLADPSRYKPEGTYEELIRSVPLLRRTVNDGRPELNILGVPIQQDRAPWSRTYTAAEQGPAHRELARLMARGYRLSLPDTSKKVFARGGWTTIEALGSEAEWKYQKYVGEGYAQLLTENRETIRALDGEALERYLSTASSRIKAMAGMRVADSFR